MYAGAGARREASSEGSLAEGTPDTDESGGEPRHRSKRRHHHHDAPKVRVHPRPPGPHSRPAPRYSRPCLVLQPGVQVAALEVQNVKRAINRYGTLPKGARIGAYLESMRQSAGGARELRDEARSLSPRTARALPHMIRSNSSGGVTQPAPASPRAARAAPLRSFADSPAKPRPRLAELEFPPPPPDLPPPPEAVQPPPPPEGARDAATDMDERSELPPPPPPDDDKPTKKNMKEMLELKLVAEIKERADKKKHRLKESPPPPDSPPDALALAPFGDPVTRLVSELSESLNMDALRRKPEPPRSDDARDTVSPIDLKASLRKTAYSNNVDQKSGELKNTTDFKSQLKKVETNKKMLPAPKEPEEPGRAIIDFKSRLRKVESGAPATTNGTGTAKRAERSPEEARDAGPDADDDDKRRSTGSISSLKKLWESKESDERLSPAAHEARRRDDKPAVPSKPAVKGKPAKQGIYATPLATAAAAADDADDAGLLAALRSTLDWCTNEVTRACHARASRHTSNSLRLSQSLK